MQKICEVTRVKEADDTYKAVVSYDNGAHFSFLLKGRTFLNINIKSKVAEAASEISDIMVNALVLSYRGEIAMSRMQRDDKIYNDLLKIGENYRRLIAYGPKEWKDLTVINGSIKETGFSSIGEGIKHHVQGITHPL